MGSKRAAAAPVRPMATRKSADSVFTVRDDRLDAELPSLPPLEAACLASKPVLQGIENILGAVKASNHGIDQFTSAAIQWVVRLPTDLDRLKLYANHPVASELLFQANARAVLVSDFAAKHHVEAAFKIGDKLFASIALAVHQDVAAVIPWQTTCPVLAASKINEHWGDIVHVLQQFPEINSELLDEEIEKELNRANKIAGKTKTDGDEMPEHWAALLTNQEYKLVEQLWSGKPKSINSLRLTAWNGRNVSDEAITKRGKFASARLVDEGYEISNLNGHLVLKPLDN